MKKLKPFLIIAVLTISSFGCGNSQKEEKKTEENEKVVTKETNLEKLETEASRLRGGSSVKSVDLHNGKATINYVKNYEEYKKLNPQSGLTEKDLNAYWDGENAVEKAVIDGSVKIMCKLDYVNEVEIVLPHNGKTYSVDVSKTELEKFTGSDFSILKDNLEHNFSDLFVYNDKERKEFLKKFGKIE